MSALGFAKGTIVGGKYEVIATLAVGGQAIVHEARCLSSGQRVVIKEVAATRHDPHHAAELERAKLAASIQIRHANVLDPIDSGTHKRTFFTVFPHVEGVDLDSLVRRAAGPIDLSDATAIARGIAGGLQSIHDAGYVHRDLKPANVLVSADLHVTIIDLGICVRKGATVADRLGSPAYMAPEQFRTPTKLDARTDTYALGLILYQMLTGRAAFQSADDDEHVRQILNTSPPRPDIIEPSVPSNLADLTMAMLAKEPSKRPMAAGDIVAKLHLGVVRCLACGGRLSTTDACAHCGRRLLKAAFGFTKGPASGQTFVLADGYYEIGRLQLAPDDPCLSRRQLRVFSHGGAVCVQDGGGANTTVVDQRPIPSRTELRPGSRLRMAQNEAVFMTS